MDSNAHAFAPRNNNLHHFEDPTIRLQEAPSSPVSISPPLPNIMQPSSAQVNTHSPPGSSVGSRHSSRHAYTTHASQLHESIPDLSLHDGQRGSDVPDTDGDYPEAEAPAQFQYHHMKMPESPAKKPYRISQMTTNSVGSSSSGGELKLPRTSNMRPASQATLGSDLRERTPFDDNNSGSGSPRVTARNISASRFSPDFRPLSYVDLLNEVPYAQQVAPAPSMNNTALQQVVGNNASLLDTKKTLDMYRANVKKTNDPATQYEFAIFMVNTANEALVREQGQGRPGSPQPESAAEMIKEARGILQRLADRAYPFAQYYLADGYFSGLFSKGKPDYDKAFPLFVAASKHGHAEAGYRAALCYEFGWGCSQSYPRAVQFFRNAASKGHPGAAVRLGKACLTGDMGLGNRYKEGIKWLKRASESADTQYNSGPYELGLLHMTGFGEDVFKDEAYASQLLTNAAELGHPEANLRLGQAYENGTMGFPKDAALSVHFYNGAAMRGVPEAMMALCAWYMVGADPVLEKDEAEAYEWAKKAAEHGMLRAPLSLLYLLHHLGLNSNSSVSVSTGLPKAEYAVGYFTETGIGCRRDPLEANVWYVRAAEKGNETASQRLAIIRAAASGVTQGEASGGLVRPMKKGQAKAKELRAGSADASAAVAAPQAGKEKGADKDKDKDCVVM